MKANCAYFVAKEVRKLARTLREHPLLLVIPAVILYSSHYPQRGFRIAARVVERLVHTFSTS